MIKSKSYVDKENENKNSKKIPKNLNNNNKNINNKNKFNNNNNKNNNNNNINKIKFKKIEIVHNKINNQNHTIITKNLKKNLYINDINTNTEITSSTLESPTVINKTTVKSKKIINSNVLNNNLKTPKTKLLSENLKDYKYINTNSNSINNSNYNTVQSFEINLFDDININNSINNNNHNHIMFKFNNVNDKKFNLKYKLNDSKKNKSNKNLLRKIPNLSFKKLNTINKNNDHKNNTGRAYTAKRRVININNNNNNNSNNSNYYNNHEKNKENKNKSFSQSHSKKIFVSINEKLNKLNSFALTPIDEKKKYNLNKNEKQEIINKIKKHKLDFQHNNNTNLNKTLTEDLNIINNHNKSFKRTKTLHNRYNNKTINEIYNNNENNNNNNNNNKNNSQKEQESLKNKRVFINKIENYFINKEIGKGSYASVKIGINKVNKKKYAIKIYNKIDLLDIDKKKTVKNEIKILKNLNNEYIMKLYEVIDTQSNLFLICEYIQGINILDYMRKNEFNENIIKKIFYQIVKGINYLQLQNICHRDIKLENILIVNNNNKEKENKNNNNNNKKEESTVKIIDFGFSAKFNNKNTYDNFFCGTPNYMSPEIVKKNKYIPFYSDIWSLGILLYAMLYKHFPFHGNSEEELFDSIICDEIEFDDDYEDDCENEEDSNNNNEKISDKAKELIIKILKKKPEDRPSTEEILLDEWFEDMD